MKTVIRSWQEPILTFLFFAFLATGLIAPISSNTLIPNLADYINHLAGIIQAKLALAEGQFPLRIAPLEEMGWRYPYYQFYGTTTYTFAALIYRWLTPSNPLMAFKITVWCGLVIGGIYMNRLAYWFIRSRPAAIIASVIFLTAPYYIIVVDRLGNLNETVALGIIPVALYYTIQRYLHPEENKTLAQAGLAWYLLCTIHIVTFIYTAFFCGLLLFLITIRNKNHWQNLISAGISFLFGCLLAMWYLAPVGFLSKYLDIATTYETFSYFHAVSPVLSNLLFSAATISSGYKSSLLTIHPAVGWPILISVGICIFALLNKLFINKKRADYWMPALLILFLLAFIMTWTPFNFWILPKTLFVGQYSWRLLGQVVWIGALLSAWAICWLFKNNLDIRHSIFAVMIIVAMASAWFPSLEDTPIDIQSFIKHPEFIYNKNSYEIDFNKHTHFIDSIDNILLYSLMSHSKLQLNVNYKIPHTLINYANAPYISMQGKIPGQLNKKQLIAIINNKNIGTLNLKSGLFHWDIPIKTAQFNNADVLSLHFELKDKQTNVEIPITRVMLAGFLKSAEMIDVKSIMSHCSQQNADTICNVSVPSSVKMLELPILYYPKLLKITLNGQPIKYQSVVYQNYMIAAISPIPGEMNTIRIQFRGLEWANLISCIAWCLWLSLILLICFKLYRLH